MTAQATGRVLLIEDEANLRNSLAFILARAGYDAVTAASGEEGVALARRLRPDAVLLDLGLPGIDGFEVAQRLVPERALGMKIIVLTGRDDEDAMVRAFDGFADDWVQKPVRPRALLARLGARLGRPEREGAPPRRVLEVGALRIDLDAHEAVHGEVTLQLTRTEFDLLVALATRPGHVHGRLDLIASVHGSACAVSERSIDFQIHGLRKKLEPTGLGIHTLRGVGFKLALA